MLSLAPTVTLGVAVLVDPGADAGGRRAAADGRPADRLRPAPRVPAASTRRPSACSSAEGCDVLAPADQGCCGALALHAGRRRRGARLRAPHDRGVRARRRRADRRQRRRLRIVDEGIRPAARRRSGVGGAGAGVFGAGPRRHRDRRRSSARRGRRGIRSRCASPTTTPVTSRTRRASASRRAICCGRSPASRSCRSPNRRSAAAAPASTTWSSPTPRASSATGRPRTSTPSARTSSPPPIPAARCR